MGIQELSWDTSNRGLQSWKSWIAPTLPPNLCRFLTAHWGLLYSALTLPLSFRAISAYELFPDTILQPWLYLERAHSLGEAPRFLFC